MYNQTNRDYYNNDDFVELFEEHLCEYTGAPYAVAVDRCTNAIFLSLEYQGMRGVTLQIPRRTYLSVPMTLLLNGYDIQWTDENWDEYYRLYPTNICDYAVGLRPGMYRTGEVQCLSFQQKKSLAIGKGGAILCDDYEMYNTLKRMRHDGRTSSMSTIDEMNSDPDSIILGYHMYMSPDEAARGILLMNQLPIQPKTGSYLDYPDISVLKCWQGRV